MGDNPSQNELPGPLVGEATRVTQRFAFAEAPVGTESGLGVIEVKSFDNIDGYRSSGKSKGIGSDMTTVIIEASDDGAKQPVINDNLSFKKGALLHTLRIRYASESWLRANGILK